MGRRGGCGDGQVVVRRWCNVAQLLYLVVGKVFEFHYSLKLYVP